MSTRLKRFALLAVGLGCVALAAGAQIRIGLIAPLSGPVPTFGISVRNGVELAIRQWNDRGGILGNRIEDVVEDGQCSADPAVRAAHTLIDEDHIQYIIGEVCSSASIPVSQIANEAQVIQITPTSTNPSVTVEGGGTKAWVFRNCFIDSYQGSIAARFAYQRLGARKAFVLRNQDNAYDSSICDAFEYEFAVLGGTITGDKSYTDETRDFRNLLSEAAGSNSNIICFPDYYNVVNLATKQAKQMQISIPFVGGDGWDSSDLDDSAASGSYFVNHYASDDPRQEVQQFLSDYRTAFGTDQPPDALSALAYDAAQMLFQSIQSAGSVDPVLVRAALEAIRFRGVTGVLTFDGYHNPLKTGVVMAVTESGPRFEADVDPAQ